MLRALIVDNSPVAREILQEIMGAASDLCVAGCAAEEPWKNRSITITSRITPDEGPGFELTTLPNPTDPENLLRAHGRGLM